MVLRWVAHDEDMTTAPVLDAEALSRLGEELGDTDTLCGFLRRYVAMLDQRIDRLECALSIQDHEGWMDAVLSLKTSSALAGAEALAAEAAALQEGSRDRTSVTCTAIACSGEALAMLRRLAAETSRQLRAFLQRLTASDGCPA